MACLIEGITVTLYEKVQIGKDAMKAPIYEEKPVKVENVLVGSPESSDIVSDMQLYGKRAAYELCIPKGDTHNWEDARVEFFGQTWKTFGFPQQYMEHMVPLDWNKKVKVERYG